MTVYWVVWDAAARWIVDRLDQQGFLPGVRRLRASGAWAGARPPRPNCQTPPSLATLFTGTWPQEHGVTGFTVPHGVADHRSGFGGGFPHQPPVWQTLAEQGLTSAFVHAPWVFDADGGLGPQVDVAIEAYSRRLATHDALAVPPGTEHHWPVANHSVVVLAGHDEVRLHTRTGTYRITPQDGWVQVRLDDGLGFWARHLLHAGQNLLLRTGVWRPRTGGRDSRLVHALSGAPVFAGEGLGRLYRAGLFGPRLAEGGDGTAEEVFLSSVECAARSFRGAAERVLHDHTADLVLIYLPMTDDVGHELIGWCDDRSGAYRPDIAEAVWQHVRRCYEWSDEVLGLLLDRRAHEDTVILSADHGMVGSTHLVHLNEQLVIAGLASRSADGRLDPTRSAVVYHPANNGSLWVNHDGLPGGTVPADLVTVTLARAMEAVAAITDPATGRRVVADFLDSDGEPWTPATADAVAYVVLADDYQPTADVDGSGLVVRPTRKTGAHVVNTGSDRLHASFGVVGPGIAPGQDLGVVDNTLAASLVLRQLGGAASTGPGSMVAVGARPPY